MDKSTVRICVQSALWYGALSVAATILNKALFNRLYFDYAVVIMLVQMALTLLVMEFSRLWGVINIQAYTLERGKDMLLPSLLYALNSYFSLSALEGMNIPMYGTLKRCVPLVTLYLGYAVLKKPKPSRGIVISVVMITGGAAIASFYDFTFDEWSYLYGFLSIILQAVYLTLIERLARNGQYSTMDMIYLNSFNCVIFFLLADLVYDEIRDAFMYFLTSASYVFWLVFVGTILVGVMLNFAIFYCTTRNSALTTSVVGNVKAVVQSFVGYVLGIYLFYDVVPSFWNVTGIFINIVGCGLYTYVKAKETAMTPGSATCA